MRERILNYIAKWESRGYPSGIPDEADQNLESMNKAPSYRAICKAILKNDIHCVSLGYSRPSCEAYSAIKRVEIEARKKNMNVYESANDRIKFIFKNFDNIYVSFSGGKDSGVMLNLVIDYMRKNKITRKIGVFHIDYEAQYQMTTDYVDKVLGENLDLIDVYRICLPLAAKCATSAYSDHWIPWDADKKDLWVRQLPENGISEANNPFEWFKKGMWDYDLQERFADWFHNKNKAKRTACLVGIRTDESLNRWRAIHSDRNKNKFQDKEWTLQMSEAVYNCYPIFDWKTEDVWTANGRLGWSYNALYDLFYKAGVPLGKMRVASPFHDSGIENLKLYKVIDPKNWAKMIGRTSGVNFAGLYGGTTAMGWREIKLPQGHTWKTYMEFLLSTLPKDTASGYRGKLEKSQTFWREKGGVLSPETIEKLRQLNVSFTIGTATNYKTSKMPVTMEYLDDIDISEFSEIPTFKRMCVCIMKNDHLCKFMGFSLTKTETEIRTRAEQKYKKVLNEKSDL